MQKAVKLPAVHLYLVRCYYVVKDELEGLFLSCEVDPIGAVAGAALWETCPDVYLGIGTATDLSFLLIAESPANPG